MVVLYVFLLVVLSWLFSVHHVERAHKIVERCRIERTSRYRKLKKELFIEREHVKLLVSSAARRVK